MSNEIFSQLISGKLYILIVLSGFLYILSWYIALRLGFRILDVNVEFKRLYPGVLVLFLNSYFGKQLIPTSVYGIVMVGLLILILKIVGRSNVLKSIWVGLLVVLSTALGDIIIASPLAINKSIAFFFFKTVLGNMVVALIELFFPTLALLILTKFKNITLIPHFRKKSTKVNLMRVAAFGLSFYLIYCSLMRLLTSLLENPRHILFNMISEWLAAMSSVVLYFFIQSETQKEYDEERIHFEYERRQHEYTQRLNEEKVAKLETQNERLNKLYEYYISNKQEVKEDLKEIKESILTIRDQNTSEINQTKALLQESRLESTNDRLTNRERDLLRLIAHDKSNKEIAVHLFISESTVKKNITDLLVKLNLRDRVQLALYALAHGLVEREELNL